MDQFQELENKGRTLIESFLKQANITDWQPTEDKYDWVDGYFTHKGNKVVAEIKVRDIKYKDYSTHLMELDKFMNMTKAKIDNDCALGLYFNFFGDDDLYIYNIRDINTIECEVTSLWCAKTTAADNGNTYKQMINIPTTKAQVYKRVDKIWYKIQN